MLFAIGSRVRFKYTGAEGEITARLGNDMLQVLLDDGDEIPAFIEDLERMDAANPQSTAKVVPGKQQKPAQSPQRPTPSMQYSILKSMGIQLAFDPEHRADGSTTQYHVYLINDMPHDVIYSYEMTVSERVLSRKNGKLDSMSVQLVGSLAFDQLNDYPQVQIECRQFTTAGSGPPFSKGLRIKPKQFFKNIITAPILNKSVHHYKLIEKLEKGTSREEDLASYTKRKVRPKSTFGNTHRPFDQHSVNDLAAFVPEIDLHIEQLTNKHKEMGNTAIIRLQLSHFEAFIEKAIRLGVERVFVIHGVGKGKLRSEIANRLINNPEVVTFKNEYHTRYGYGATEVIFIEEKEKEEG